MPLVVIRVDAAASAARLSVLAFLLAGAAVVLVLRQVHALVVAACRVRVAVFQVGADLIVLIAMVGCSRVFGLSQETTQPFRRQQQVVFIVKGVLFRHESGVLFFFTTDPVHGHESDGQSHGCCYD